ncbi:MAG: hypothetical protein PHI49_07080 [Halothiobacillaceae bacterium]|jgi:hypothetical protein|nr:hypothetical protein [Halothiobacillaceae bacterium]MDY0050131.1 hypothetical protein [Halothiobacillaceae bacterium]
MKHPRTLTLLGLGLCLAQGSTQAAPQLYETGPAEDAAFVRFIDALPTALDVRAGKGAHIALTPEERATTWQPVKARAALGATLEQGGRSEKVELSVEPSEFVNVVAVPDGAGWRVEIGREKPDDFSAHKVSLGLLNLDTACSRASLRVAGKTVMIVEGVAPRETRRRQINPVALSVDLLCDGQPSGSPLDLGSLRAGERWTLLAHPSPAGTRLLPILDRMP